MLSNLKVTLTLKENLLPIHNLLLTKMSDQPLSAFSMYQKQKNTKKKSNSKGTPRKGIKSEPVDEEPIKKQHVIKTNAKNVPKEKRVKHKVEFQRRLKKLKKLQKKKKDKPIKYYPNPYRSTLEAKPSIAQPKLKLENSFSAADESFSSSEESADFYNKPRRALEWIIAPVMPKDFFINEWEKAPLLIKRNLKHYYNQILSTEKLDDILRNNSLFYTRNVDVVSYVDGKRETHNPEGRAIPAVLWDYYENGCSIRILNPQTYCPKLHSLLTALQEYFGCMAGVNAYLTPPNSQGFAPHYDDIEAFVLQLEGRKHWKLYAPLTKSEVLPRFSSKNLDRGTLKAPIKEATLEAGDLLYFPRGTIHEGYTDAGAHSLHITVSVYQKTAYVDLLEHILKPALATAAQEDVEFREGLPLQYLQHIGLANAAKRSEKRNEIIAKVQSLFNRVIQHIDVDAAADQLGKQFMWDAMPPVPSKQEKLHMVHGNGERMLNGTTYNKVEITVEIEVRLLRYHCIRIIKEEEEREADTLRVYYNSENAKYYHGEEQQFIVIDSALEPAVKFLIHSYPQYVTVKSLPLNSDVDKMQLVSDLWERGLLVTCKPLE